MSPLWYFTLGIVFYYKKKDKGWENNSRVRKGAILVKVMVFTDNVRSTTMYVAGQSVTFLINGEESRAVHFVRQQGPGGNYLPMVRNYFVLKNLVVTIKFA